MTIMQDQPSSYTAYARSLCPSWCTETHDEQTDPNDVGAVHHRGGVGLAADFDVSASKYDSLNGTSEPGAVFLDNVLLTPEEATALGLLLIRAAEVARRG